MGNEEVKVAVADAGLLIHLGELGGLTLLQVFDTISACRMAGNWQT